MKEFVPSERHLGMLRCIRDSVEQRGYPPTMREMGRAVGVSSSNTAFVYVDALRFNGYVDGGYLPRTIRLTDKGREAIDGREE